MAHDGGTRINKRLLDLGYARADVNALSQHREVRAEQPLTHRVWKRVLPLLVEELARGNSSVQNTVNELKDSLAKSLQMYDHNTSFRRVRL